MRSFAIEDPGSPDPPLYATLEYTNTIISQAELEPESPAGPPDGGTGVKDWLKQQPGRSI